jgi:regulator of protease activity HflC (stomatin/prohibitin superfamily)
VSYEERETNPIRWVAIILGVILMILVAVSATRIFENVPADQLVVIQSPISGDLTWYTTPGLKWQGFGAVTSYNRSFQYWFSKMADQGKGSDQSLETRFNDGGHAKISGSVRVDLPLTPDQLTALHIRYGSQDAIEKELIRPTFERAVYMSGPLMSSAESYSDRRNQLIFFIEDQATKGVYKTSTRMQRTKDPITGAEKTVSVVDLIPDPGNPATYLRSEMSPVSEFGLKVYNLSINSIEYSKIVDDQIQTQQKAIMEVQTAIAESRKAEQRALTTEQEGKASAAKAKWEQEAIKAKAVTEGEQRKEVARLAKETAEFYKQEQILRAEGDSEYKRKVMEADGALTQKLETYKVVMMAFADQIGKQRWTPEIVMGGAPQQGPDQMAQMINILTAKAAKDLALEMAMTGKK